MKILCTLVFVKLSEGSVFGRLTVPAESYARIELECEKLLVTGFTCTKLSLLNRMFNYLKSEFKRQR